MQSGTKRKRVPLELGIGPEAAPAVPETPSDSLAGLASAPVPEPPAGFSPNGRLPQPALGVDWKSPWREFRSSVGAFFSGQRAPKDDELPEDSDLRVHWIKGRNSPWAFAAASAWHVIVVVLLVLPIWGFLPATAHNLAPPQIEVSWTAPQDLPPIHLPAPVLPAAKPEPSKAIAPKIAEKQPPAREGADAFHPRQTILSIPVRITHPRQTLIEPAAPMAPPKIDPQLPNLVQWAANTPAPAVRLQLAPSMAAPRMRERRMRRAVAPEIANLEKNPGPLNIASSAVVNPAPRMPMVPMSAATARFQNHRVDGAEAPQVNAASGEAGLRDVIALSASPAPPAPVVAVPRGNLAARIAMSPSGMRRGTPNGAGTGSTNRGAGGAAGHGSLPAAVSISGGNGRAAGSGGGIAPRRAPKLMLAPMNSLPGPPPPNFRRGPANVSSLAPNESPEALFAGRDIHTLNITLPNVTSMTGNWTLNFVQLDEGTSPFNRPTGVLSGPLPIIKVDPRYPPEAIRKNIEGEVVLYAIIRANGSVDSIQVVRRLDPVLDQCAVQALAQWKFRPAARNGKPVAVEAIVHIPFNYHAPEQ